MNIVQGLVRLIVFVLALVIALPVAFVRMLFVSIMGISDGIISETYPQNKFKKYYEDDNSKKD